MKINNIYNIEGKKFPAGRVTKVIIGPGASIEAKNFVIGYVTIYPQGSVPFHSHVQEEVYIIISGEGIMYVDEEKQSVREGDYIYIPSNSRHLIKNTSSKEMKMIFCYSPKGIVEHWKMEMDGKLK